METGCVCAGSYICRAKHIPALSQCRQHFRCIACKHFFGPYETALIQKNTYDWRERASNHTPAHRVSILGGIFLYRLPRCPRFPPLPPPPLKLPVTLFETGKTVVDGTMMPPASAAPQSFQEPSLDITLLAAVVVVDVLDADKARSGEDALWEAFQFFKPDMAFGGLERLRGDAAATEALITGNIFLLLLSPCFGEVVEGLLMARGPVSFPL